LNFTNENDFNQMKTGKDNITPINEDTINRITKIKAFENDVMNELLYQNHKKLLMRAMNKNKSHEVGLFWDLSNYEEECLEILGKVNGFSMKDNPKVYDLVANSRNLLSVVVMHNHPRNGLFSSQDIDTFATFDTIFLLTAVCNDGNIYMIRKEQNFNPLLLMQYYNDGAELSKKLSMDEKIRKAKKKGIDIKEPKNKEIIMKIPTKAYYCGIKNVAKHAKEIGITYRYSAVRKGVR